jgi:hypothetical protein
MLRGETQRGGSRRRADGQASLTPESRALLLDQLERQDHAQRLLGDGAPA